MTNLKKSKALPESIWLDQPLELIENGSVQADPALIEWSIYSDWSGSSVLLLNGMPPTISPGDAKQIAHLLFSGPVPADSGRMVKAAIKGGGHALPASSSAPLQSRSFTLQQVTIGRPEAAVDYFDFYIIGFHWLNQGKIDLDIDSCGVSIISTPEAESSNEHAHVFLKNHFSCILRISTGDTNKASKIRDSVVLGLSLVCGTQVSSTASVGIDARTEEHSTLTLSRVMRKPFHGVPLIEVEKIPTRLEAAAQKLLSLDRASLRLAKRVVSLFVESVNQSAVMEVRCLIACMTVEEFVHKLFGVTLPQSVKPTTAHKRALKQAASDVCKDLSVSDDLLGDACESFWKVAKSKLDLDVFACAQLLGADVTQAEATEFAGFRNALVHDRDPRSNKRVKFPLDEAGILESYRRVLLIMDKLIIGYFCSTKPDIDRGMLIKNSGLGS
jgi:hypothetical protein